MWFNGFFATQRQYHNGERPVSTGRYNCREQKPEPSNATSTMGGNLGTHTGKLTHPARQFFVGIVGSVVVQKPGSTEVNSVAVVVDFYLRTLAPSRFWRPRRKMTQTAE